jgi:hypothetical protein
MTTLAGLARMATSSEGSPLLTTVKHTNLFLGVSTLS